MDVAAQILEDMKRMTPAELAAHKRMIDESVRKRKFIPSPGPQTEAYFSKADILLFGGQAGGGKSAMGLGLALTEHERSLCMRRQYTDLSGLTEEVLKLNGTRDGYNGSIPPTLRTSDGRLIEFGACQRLGDEENWQGRPHDLIFIDECCGFLESQVRFLIGWLRSSTPGQRCRVILATNPPLSAEGEWVISMFAPWLDPGHVRPAKDGELRWFISDEEGRDVELEDKNAVAIVNGKPLLGKNGKPLKPMSRTFIRSSVEDNPFLANTDYAAKLDSLRPELRASLRDGNFMANRRDDAMQVVPTAWIRAAQARWKPQKPSNIPMCALGVDCSGGGVDPTVLAPRYDGYFPELTVIPAKETPNGNGIAGHILKIRIDGARIALDMGGGYGNLPFQQLKENGLEPMAFKGNETSNARTANGVYGFFNKRSEVIWKFAEALNPDQPGGSVVALPPDPILVAELSAPRYDITNKNGKSVIRVEPKDDIKSRLGRSPDRADAVTISWSIGVKGINLQGGWQQNQNRENNPRVNLGHDNQRRKR